MPRFFIGVDVGTSACKVSLVADDAAIVASATRPYPTHRPHPLWAEQDPLAWWRATIDATREVVAAVPDAASAVEGIGVVGQSWAGLLVDREGDPLHPALIWQDRRAEEASAELRRAVPEEVVLASAGNRIDPAYVTPKLVWLRQAYPAAARRAFAALQSNAFVVHRLTGQFTQDLSQGYGHANFDIRTGRWNHEITRAMGLPVDWFPRIYRCSELVGMLQPSAAQQLGLCDGIPVVAGGLDAASGSLAAGVVQAGQTQEQGGQAGGMSILVDQPTPDARLILSFHVLDDAWLLQGGTTGGGSLRWLQSLLPHGADPYPFGALGDEAAAVGPGSGGVVFLPYLAGERSPIWDSHARGCFLGLSYGTDRGRLARAVMEGCAFALRHNLDVAREAGSAVSELRSVGGAAASHIWTQIKADVTGLPIVVPDARQDTAFGAALLAGIGVGAWPGTGEALASLSRVERRHVPDQTWEPMYDELYAVYRGLYPTLMHDMRRLATMDGGPS